MEEKRQVPTSEEHALPSCVRPVTDTGRGGRGTRENHAGWVGGGQVALGIHHSLLHLPYPSDGGGGLPPPLPTPRQQVLVLPARREKEAVLQRASVLEPACNQLLPTKNSHSGPPE